MLSKHFTDGVPCASMRSLAGMALAGFFTMTVAPASLAIEFNVRQIADDTKINREPVVSENGMIVWYAGGTNEYDLPISDIYLLDGGERKIITDGMYPKLAGNVKPQVQGDSVTWIGNFEESPPPHTWVLREVPNRDEGAVELRALYKWDGTQWVESQGSTNGASAGDFGGGDQMPDSTNAARRMPHGREEVCIWRKNSATSVQRITTDSRRDLAPSIWGGLVAWQVEKGWPFGWEIMAWENGEFMQLTTNFYYDMAPKVNERQITWYGWDGHDFEIFLFDKDKGTSSQITSNQYDDVAPVIWSGQIAWEGYPAAESDIYLLKDGKIDKLSDNIEDDFYPRLWNGKVIWQGFDGDDFEIYYYDPEKQTKAVKVTNNLYDDTRPDLRDGLACWMGYFENWDAEIFAWDGTGEPVMITNNEEEDREPRTAGRRIVWQGDTNGKALIYLAEPK
jgi:hypothetical protein